MAILCVAPACRNIVRDGISPRCEKHRTVAKRQSTEIRKFNGTRRNAKVYDSKRWRVISIKKRTVTPFCENCDDQGLTTLAAVVDHIVEIEDGGDPYLWSNLKSLCHQCHNTKTAEERRKRNGTS